MQGKNGFIWFACPPLAGVILRSRIGGGYIILLFGLSLFFTSCQLPEPDKIDPNAERPVLPDQIGKDVEIIHSEQGIKKILLTAPTLVMHDSSSEQYNEFPDGVALTFYDKAGEKNADLTGKYAIDYPKSKKRYIRDSVIIITSKGDRIEADDLHMNEQADSIYTNKPVKITRTNGDLLYGPDGLTSNTRMDDIYIPNVRAPQLTVQQGQNPSSEGSGNQKPER